MIRRAIAVCGAALLAAFFNYASAQTFPGVGQKGDCSFAANGALTCTLSNGVSWPNLPATGGTSQFLKQGSVGGAVTVVRPDAVDSTFTQSGTGAGQTNLDARSKNVVYASDFTGVDPTGAADSATGIQNAINSLPVKGGFVDFVCGTYKIASTINLGDGSTSQVSTRSGMHLRGLGSWAGWAASDVPQRPCVTFKWAGAANGTMVAVNGPLHGWGVHNITFDGNMGAGFAGFGLKVISAANGSSENLDFENNIESITITTQVTNPAGVTDTNSMHNSFFNTSITMGADTANMKGINLASGNAASLSNASFNHFFHVQIIGPPAAVSTAIYLAACDTDSFFSVQIIDVGNVNFSGVAFDYTPNGGFPNSNTFFQIDNSVSGTAWKVIGSPSQFQPNTVLPVSKGNGGPAPNVTNVSYFDPFAIKVLATTVASLPTCNAGNEGARAAVTNATSATFLAAAVNGGTNHVPVYCDGTSWKVGG